MKFPKSTCARTTALARLRIATLFFPVLCVMIFSAQRLYAQNAALTGLITDPSGAMIPHAQVTLTDERTSTVWKATTNDRGLYSVPNIAPGKYTLDVDAPGFKHYKQTDINVDPAQAVAFDAHLQLNGAEQSVTVNGGNMVADTSHVGLLGDRSIMDTPFNTTSYTSETMQNQQARSVSEVLNNDSSVRSIWSQGSYTDLFNIRGFIFNSNDLSWNGLYGVVPAQMVSPDYADRIELLKGATALLTGISPSGAIGGAINVVPKRATDAPIREVTLTYGQSGQGGAHVDLGQRFGTQRQWGARFNGTFRNGNTALDGSSQLLAAPIVNLDYRGNRLRVSLDLGYQNQRFYGLAQPVYPFSGFQIPAPPKATLNFFPSWSYSKTYDSFAAANVEYDIAAHWRAFVHAGGRSNTNKDLQTQPNLLNAAGDLDLFPDAFASNDKTKAAQAGIRGTFRSGPIHHEMVISGDFYHERNGTSLFFPEDVLSNMYDPTNAPAPSLDGYTFPTPRTSTRTNSSLAIADTASILNNRIQLTVGVREQGVETSNYNGTTGARTTHYDKSDLTPAVALVVRPSHNVSLYANYIDGLQVGPTAPSTAKNANEVFPPFISKQYEVGVKTQLGRFGTTLDVFQIKQPNGITDPNTLIFGVNGQQRNRGVELNTTGNVVRGFRVLGGITIMDGIQTNTGNSATQGKNAIGVPKFLLNVGGEWDAPFIPRLTLTGRAIYTGSQYVDAQNTQPISDWETFDAGARYMLRRSSDKPITFRGQVLNIANKSYWGEASSFGLARGGPRTVLLSTTFTF